MLIVASVSALAGLHFGLSVPFGGAGEAAAVAVVGGWFLITLGRAFRAIRGGDVARHREWMIRAFAVAIGVSTVRVVAVVLDIALAPARIPPRDMFVLSIWIGWAITLLAAERWIVSTRPRAELETIRAKAA